MAAKKKKKWTYKVDNKMRGAFGETDFDKRVVRINKARHKKKKAWKSGRYPKKERTILNTIVHEKMHIKHPKATEKAVVKKARNAVARMSPKAKQRAYKLFQYPKKSR